MERNVLTLPCGVRRDMYTKPDHRKTNRRHGVRVPERDPARGPSKTLIDS
jgi:hypothetical protein